MPTLDPSWEAKATDPEVLELTRALIREDKHPLGPSVSRIAAELVHLFRMRPLLAVAYVLKARGCQNDSPTHT